MRHDRVSVQMMTSLPSDNYSLGSSEEQFYSELISGHRL